METTAAKKWLYQTLTGSSSLISALGGSAVYADLIPQGSATPAIVYNVQSNQDDNNVNGTAVMGVPIMQVKCITEGYSFGSADTIMGLANSLLCGVQGSVTGYKLLCRRIGQVDYTEVADGVRYNHLGGLYEIHVFGTA